MNAEHLIMTNKDNVDDELSDADNTSDYSSEEQQIDVDNVPDISQIEMTKKETFHYKIINNYYKGLSREKVITMIDIVGGKSKISLRLLDFFITRYANKYKIRFERVNNTFIEGKPEDRFDSRIDEGFNVHISYKAQLKSYTKTYFDPFRRRKKFKYYFDKDHTLMLCTTLGQLNFFKWAFTNSVIEYVQANYATISKAMLTINKTDKAKKQRAKRKTKKSNQNINQNQVGNGTHHTHILNNTNKQTALIVKKNGVSIASRKNTGNDAKIVLSFD